MTLPLLAEVLEFYPKSLQPPYFRASLGHNVVNSQIMTLLLSQALEKRGSAGLEYVDHPRGTLRAQNEVIDLHYTLRIISGQKCTYKCTEMLRKNERLFNILRIISSKRSWDQLSRMDNTSNKIILPVTRTFGTSVSSLFQIKQEVCEGRMVV